MERWKILIAILPFYGITNSFAQGNPPNVLKENSVQQAAPQNWLQENSGTVLIFDKDGRPFANPNSDVEGSAFFSNDWKTGRLVLYDNTVFSQIKLRLNLQSQQVHYLSPGGIEKVAHEGSVKEIMLYDSTAGHNAILIFRSGFPPIDNQDLKNFYQILSNGKIQFLRSSRRIISIQKDQLSGEVKKEFVNYEDYYVFAGGTMTRVKRDKPFVLHLLNDQEEKVKAFIDDKKFKFRSFDDITQIITYYNSLP
jgi:hypothetical protein